MLAHQLEGVYHLGAYSGGATIAFEMACQLKAKGKQVGVIVIFDSYPLRLTRFTYQRIGMVYVLRSIRNLILSSNLPLLQKVQILLNGIPQIVEENWMRIKLRAEERKASSSLSPANRIFMALRISNDRYRFKFYPGSLLFIRAIENQARYLRNSDFGWGRYAANVSVFDLPCDHKGLFKNKENVKAVATILEMHLAEFEGRKGIS
jgi:thioesterase domain-containing protein